MHGAHLGVTGTCEEKITLNFFSFMAAIVIGFSSVSITVIKCIH